MTKFANPQSTFTVEDERPLPDSFSEGPTTNCFRSSTQNKWRRYSPLAHQDASPSAPCSGAEALGIQNQARLSTVEHACEAPRYQYFRTLPSVAQLAWKQAPKYLLGPSQSLLRAPSHRGDSLEAIYRPSGIRPAKDSQIWEAAEA